MKYGWNSSVSVGVSAADSLDLNVYHGIIE